MSVTRVRAIGGGVAAVIAVVIAAVASVAADFHVLWAGVPCVALLGWWLGPKAHTHPILAALALTVGAVVLSDYLVVAVASIGSTGVDVAGFLLLGLLGLLYVGVPALILTGPASVVWLVLVRRLAARPAA